MKEILKDGVVSMAQETTFTMKEARGRYIGVFSLFLLFASLFGFFPIALIIAAALQACLFRLSKPTVLALAPTVIILPILFLLYGIEAALIVSALVLAIGWILRLAQTKHIGKNVTVSAMTAAFIIAIIAAFSIWLWKQNALSGEGLRLFFETLQKTVIAELRAWLEGAGATANVSQEDIDLLIGMTEESLAGVLLLLPSLLAILFFAVSCAVIGLYKLICRLFKMKDGLSQSEWRFSVSVPFAAFYLLLLILSFFVSGENAFFIMCTNMRVLLSVFIAIVGTSMLIGALTRAFPRVSSRFFCVLAILFLGFSTYSVLVWQIIAAVTAVRVMIGAFRRENSEE